MPPPVGVECHGRDELGLPGASEEVAGVAGGQDRWARPMGGPASQPRKEHLELAFLLHLLSWEATGLRSVRTASFGVWGAPEPQV